MNRVERMNRAIQTERRRGCNVDFPPKFGNMDSPDEEDEDEEKTEEDNHSAVRMKKKKSARRCQRRKKKVKNYAHEQLRPG